MSANAVEQFWMQVGNDAELQKKVEGLFQPIENQPSAKATSVVELAKEHGFDFTIEELRAHLVAQGKKELSETELAAVAGGTLNAYYDTYEKFEPSFTSFTMFKLQQGTLLF